MQASARATANYCVAQPLISASNPGTMIVGNRKQGAFVVLLAISLLFFTLGIVFWFRKHRTTVPQPPLHTCLYTDEIYSG
jgi:hypothetical protein